MNQDIYKKILNPESGALREAWFQTFSERAVIGRVFGSKGDLVFPGKSPFDWLTETKIFSPEDRKNPNLTADDLREKFSLLAQYHGTASSHYAILKLVSEALRGQISAVHSEFIKNEMAKYSSGGEFFDETTKKPLSRRPAKDTVEALAEAQTIEMQKELHWYAIQADFFQAIMANLEMQRRCLKDYAETYRPHSQNGF